VFLLVCPDAGARAKGQKIAILNADRVEYFWGVNPSWDATNGPWHLYDVKGFELEPDRMDKNRSEAVERSERAVPAPWLAGTEGVKKTGQCISPLEILLVEDDAGDTVLINEIISELSIPVNLHLARDGEQALQMLSDHLFEPDLVILDLNLPKVSGHEVLERRPLRTVPVVVFTGSTSEADIQRSLNLGAQEYFRKPLDLDAYREVVRRIVEKRARTPAKVAQVCAR
jgi:CheY-like chemotaxis protein